MREALLDTNVVSELTRPVPEPMVLEFVGATSTTWYSAITLQELRFGVILLDHGRRRDVAESALNRFLKFYARCILPVSEEIADKTAYIRLVGKRSGHEPSLADAIIAATASVYDLPLVTRNTKDFAGLGVHLINPWKHR